MNSFSKIHMPALICGRGSISFVASLGSKKVAVIGYNDSVKQYAEALFKDTDSEVRYITTISQEPQISDIYDNLPTMINFEPDLILAIGGGSVMDVAKGLHLFYENPTLSLEDSLKPFSLPLLGRKAQSAYVPTTSGTGSEASSAAVFIDEKTQVKKLMLSNTLIPHYAVLDPDLTVDLPTSVQIATALDALCHAIESASARNANSFTRAMATNAALDIMESIPLIVQPGITTVQKLEAQDILHTAAYMAGIAITNSCTGIVHSYDHPGPAFHLPHGIVCGIMLPYSIQIIGPHPSYAILAKRLGYAGDTAQLTQHLVSHIQKLNSSLGLPLTFKEKGVPEKDYFKNVPTWAEISIPAFATQMSPAGMDTEKGTQFYSLCYHGQL